MLCRDNLKIKPRKVPIVCRGDAHSESKGRHLSSAVEDQEFVVLNDSLPTFSLFDHRNQI